MKHLFVLFVAVTTFVAVAHAETLRPGTYRGSLHEVGDPKVDDGQPSRLVWAAQVKKNGDVFEVRNLRGFKYRVVTSAARSDEYLGSTTSVITTPRCLAVPSIRIRTTKGARTIVVFQTIDFSCVSDLGHYLAYQRIYAGELVKK